MDSLKQFGNIPIEYHAIKNIMQGYRYPADKIMALEREGKIIRLKKGLFVVSEQITGKPISRELIANHLYGPSYISFEYALSWHGLIPERVYSIRSITTKRSRGFSNKLGQFDYTSTQKDYFHIGIRQITDNPSNTFFIAAPEKALCDMINYTSKLRIQSLKAMIEYVKNDLRIDTDLRQFDPQIIKRCLQYGKKKNALNLLLKCIEL